jgi:hypothetical protein
VNRIGAVDWKLNGSHAFGCRHDISTSPR